MADDTRTTYDPPLAARHYLRRVTCTHTYARRVCGYRKHEQPLDFKHDTGSSVSKSGLHAVSKSGLHAVSKSGLQAVSKSGLHAVSKSGVHAVSKSGLQAVSKSVQTQAVRQDCGEAA